MKMEFQAIKIEKMSLTPEKNKWISKILKGKVYVLELLLEDECCLNASFRKVASAGDSFTQPCEGHMAL